MCSLVNVACFPPKCELPETYQGMAPFYIHEKYFWCRWERTYWGRIKTFGSFFRPTLSVCPLSLYECSACFPKHFTIKVVACLWHSGRTLAPQWNELRIIFWSSWQQSPFLCHVLIEWWDHILSSHESHHHVKWCHNIYQLLLQYHWLFCLQLAM